MNTKRNKGTYTLDAEQFNALLAEVNEHLRVDVGSAYAVCSVLASIIASAATSIDRQNLMDACARNGFQPEFYVNTIRVHHTSTRAKYAKNIKEQQS
jgi:hypothetical protein